MSQVEFALFVEQRPLDVFLEDVGFEAAVGVLLLPLQDVFYLV